MPKLFADFETSGLNPTHDHPLEFAMVVTDDLLQILAEKSFLIYHSKEEVEELYSSSHEKVVQMHEKNDLWEDLLATTGEHSVKPGEFEASVNAFLDLAPLSFGVQTRDLQIAGFNPFFDRKWLEALAPSALRRIHYRSYDVSSLRTMAHDCGLGDPPRGSEVPHRSLGDCHAAIEYARWFRSQLIG